MRQPAAYMAAEGPIRTAKSVSGRNLPHIPRSQVRDAIRVCLDLGYCVSGAEAWRLIKDWHEFRRDDARRFVASEFGTYIQRRGDLTVLRSKPRHAWRTHT